MTDLAAPPAEAPTPEEAAGPSGDGYRPHLDGVRAVAVYLVVLFHAGLRGFDGGFVGVDVFFVLSGYLVTRMLMKDVAAGGTIRFRRFYARRFRRLLPASAVALTITAIAYSAVADPIAVSSARRAFQASFLYVANWYFIHQSTGYFGAEVATNPVLHVWSLAVEEQFYLVWPLLLAGLIALARRSPWRPLATVRGAVAVGGAASLAWALLLQHSHPDRAYYGTDARAYQLFAGALLALSPTVVGWVRRRGPLGLGAGAAGMAAIVLLATSLLDVGPITRGALVTVAAVALLAGLEAAPHGPLHRVLSIPPIAYLGRISYGTYLWHWPVIVIALIVGEPGPIGLTALTLLVATGLASLSYELLEMPIRRSAALDRVPIPVIAIGLATSVLAAAVVIPAVIDRAHRSPAADAAATPAKEGFTPVPADLDILGIVGARFGETVECIDREPDACTIERGTGKHVLLMGDSNAEMLIPAFRAMAKAEGLTLSLAVTEGCPWQRHFDFGRERVKERCQTNKEDAYQRVIPALDPDVIVLANADYPKNLVAFDEIRTTTGNSLKELRSPGRRIVMVEPMVQAPTKPGPLECLDDARFVEECRYVADTTPSPVDQLYRRLAGNSTDLVSADLDRLACPFLPICDPIVGGKVVRWDFQHLAEGYAATLGDELATYFRAIGVLPA